MESIAYSTLKSLTAIKGIRSNMLYDNNFNYLLFSYLFIYLFIYLFVYLYLIIHLVFYSFIYYVSL